LLLELRVRDVGIIEDIGWTLAEGLNVITGETGAGKSLVIDAVEALLGARPDDDIVRHGADEARIEGVFALPEDAGVRQVLREKEIEAEDGTLVVRCEVRRRGRSVIRVNDRAVPRPVLQQLGRSLVDIHGQSDHLSLLDARRQLTFLDAFAHTDGLADQFGGLAAELQRAEQELRALAQDEREAARREEFLRYQVDEISRADLHEGEDEELDRERNVLASAEHLKMLAYDAYRGIYGDDSADPAPSALDRLGEAVTGMRKLVEMDPGMRPVLDSLEEALYGLEETAKDVRTYGDRLEHDPQRLDEIESRLETIRDLKRKYGQSIGEVLAFGKRAASDLEGISGSAERRAELEARCGGLRREMGDIASRLSDARGDAAVRLGDALHGELRDLDMPQVAFEVSISREESADGIPYPDGRAYAFTSDGADNVEFMASTNPGEPLKSLARIASTGEVSRFMLALKGALSEADSTPVLVFDEVDIGVGGRSGEVVGRKLWKLARNHQTICITHLPQIAAFADAHYRVVKEASGERTLSRLEALDGEARTEELAAMLAGPQVSDTSLEGARELMRRAEEWKGG
jgi:DNA repair protein RecN (Recombination protein N)